MRKYAKRTRSGDTWYPKLNVALQNQTNCKSTVRARAADSQQNSTSIQIAMRRDFSRHIGAIYHRFAPHTHTHTCVGG